MKRSLALVLNGRKSNTMLLSETVYLELVKMDSQELDKYISKNFNSSEEIRKKYEKSIVPFLNQHNTLINRIQNETGKKYDGSVVITEFHDDLTIERKKVLYKKDIIQFKEITKNKKFILALESYDYLSNQSADKSDKKYCRIFPEYYGKELKFYCHSEEKFKRIMGEWRTMLKNSPSYYDVIRIVLKEYQNRYKELGLASLDVIYSSYLNKKKKNITNFLEDIEYLDVPKPKYEEPTRYPKIYDEEGYPGDLEDHWPQKDLQSDLVDECDYEDYDEDGLEDSNKIKKKIK